MSNFEWNPPDEERINSWDGWESKEAWAEWVQTYLDLNGVLPEDDIPLCRLFPDAEDAEDWE
jgi:hypothetical protein